MEFVDQTYIDNLVLWTADKTTDLAAIIADHIMNSDPAAHELILKLMAAKVLQKSIRHYDINLGLFQQKDILGIEERILDILQTCPNYPESDYFIIRKEEYEVPIGTFLFLWDGKIKDGNLKNEYNDDVITVTGGDPITGVIPDGHTGTFSVPYKISYNDADEADKFWFDGLNLLQKTHAELIISNTMRTFVKYSDFPPYDIQRIGILNPTKILNQQDKQYLDTFFRLWLFYWGTFSDYGYLKDNRTIE